MYEIGDQVVVGKGTVSRTGRVNFGGVDSWADASDDRERVRIAVILKTGEDDESYGVDLAVGDSFEVAGQTWQLAEINSSGPMRWGATLTRIA